MNLDEIRKIARTNMAGRKAHRSREAGYIYHHGHRTARLAGEIQFLIKGEADLFDPVLYAGALFHDVGKGFEAHNETGAHLVRRLLGSVCSSEELDGICEIVRFHCLRKHGLNLVPRVLWVQDADILDHVGTQDVWLKFLHSAFECENQEEALAYWQSDSAAEHLSGMRDMLNFDVSKELYDERVAFNLRFIERFRAESGGEIFRPE